MAGIWMAGDEVYDLMRELIAHHHPHLATCDEEIAIVFKEKASSSGDVAIVGKSKKASPLMTVLSNKKWQFVIELAADVWSSYDDHKQRALLDHHLCALRIDDSDPTKGLKFYLSPPDVAFYKGELERHGLWRTSGSDVPKTLIEEMFGESSEDDD